MNNVDNYMIHYMFDQLVKNCRSIVSIRSVSLKQSDVPLTHTRQSQCHFLAQTHSSLPGHRVVPPFAPNQRSRFPHLDLLRLSSYPKNTKKSLRRRDLAGRFQLFELFFWQVYPGVPSVFQYDYALKSSTKYLYVYVIYIYIYICIHYIYIYIYVYIYI